MATLDKSLLQQLRVDFKEAIKSVEEKYGMELKLGKISYSYNQFTGKLEGTLIQEGSSAEQTKFNELCRQYGFTEEDYGRTFVMQDITYELCGFAPNRRKYPIVARSHANQKEYCFVPRDVKAALEK